METSSSNPANRRRSKRVMLQLPIVVLTYNTDGIAQSEETNTLIVNAHGGLLKLKMEVLAGQPIMLRNPLGGMEEACHVVRVEHPPGGHTAVAFEFDHPSPKFWPIEFPPEDWKNAEE